jgi:hypothetical protein
LLFAALCTAAAARGEAPVEVKTLAGPSHSGELVSLSATEIVVDVAGDRKTLPLKEVLRVAFPKAAVKPAEGTAAWIELIDGSKITGRSFQAAGSEATVELLAGGAVKIPTSAIRSVLLQPHSGAAEAVLAQQWDDIRSQPAKDDVLVIRKKTSLPAEEPGGEEKTVLALDYLGGVLYDVTDTMVVFEYDGEKRNVRRDRVEGLIYYHGAGRELPEPVARVADAAGDVWNAKSLALAEGKLKLVAANGASRELPLDHVKEIDFSAGKVVYLSDLKPASVEWTPFFDASSTPSAAVFYQPRFDQALGGHPLQIGDQTFEKGVSMRSRTRITWRLPGAFRKLLAVAGIDYRADDNGGKSGDVQLVVLGDDKPLYDQRIKGDDGGVNLDIDLTGVKRLTVLVDYGGNIDIADYFDLGDARVTK